MVGGMNISAAVDQGDVAAIRELLGAMETDVQRAIVRAVNKVSTSARAEFVRRVAASINLSPTELRNRNIALTKASYATMQALIGITGRRVGLAHFAARDLRRSGRGVSYAIQAGQRKTIAHAFINTTMGSSAIVFVRRTRAAASRAAAAAAERVGMRRLRSAEKRQPATVHAAYADAEARRSAYRRQAMMLAATTQPSALVGRLPIEKLYGPSVPEVFGNIAELAAGVLEAKLAEKLSDEIRTQAELVLAGRAPAGGGGDAT